MAGAGFRLWHRLPRPRWWASGLCAAGLPLLAAGCADRAATLAARGAYPDSPYAVSGRATAVSAVPEAAPTADTALAHAAPAKGSVCRVSYEPDPAAAQAAAPAATPVNLDSVFRLAEQQNPQIAVAREKLNESLIQNDLAAKGWMPKVTAGVGYYRHEGGIQNPDGTFVRSSFGALYPGLDLHTEFDVREATFARVQAEQKRWQQQGELSRIDNEQLREAAETYIDLLTARRGEAVSKELEKYQRDVLKRAQDTAKEGGQALVESVQAELSGTEAAGARLRQQGDAASAKLAYLLGLDPLAPLVPVDETLAPIDVVDASAPTPALVARALEDGPGVRELQQMLAAIDAGMAELSGCKKYLPTLDLCAGEGAFGAGPGDSMIWDNRLDVGVNVRWNLTELFKAKDEQRLADSRRRQVELSYDDLRGKLTLGVKESQEAIVGGREQIDKASEQIKRASEAYRISNLRLTQNAPGATPAEVLQSLRGLEQAHFNYITSVNAFNKAQVRLLLLLGPAAACKPVAPATGTVTVEPAGK